MTAAKDLPREVHVRTPARLHLGIFNLPTGGFGGLGVAIRTPNVALDATHAAETTAHGPQADRAAAAARRFHRDHGIPGGARVRVRSAIPPHIGLGSGTQMELAVRWALAQLHGLPADPEALARAAGRLRRSRIGLEAFRRGGFVVHALLDGEAPETRVLPFPDDWAFVTVLPARTRGLFGPAEERAFQALAPMGPALVREIHDLVRGELLPGLQDRDIRRFGRAMSAIQVRVGDYFAACQGGRFSHPRAAEIERAMYGAGACGVAQSSWGPSLCALAPAGAAAERVRAAVAATLAGPAPQRAPGTPAPQRAPGTPAPRSKPERRTGPTGPPESQQPQPDTVMIALPDNQGVVWEMVPCA